MSAVDELIGELVARGMTPGDAACMVARAGAEIATPRRSKGAIRTARWRDNLPSQTVTERHAVTPEEPAAAASPNVTERHKPSHGDGAHISTSSNEGSKNSDKKEEKIEAPRSKKASRISADWQLDQRHIDYAISKGVAPERIPILGEKFRNHWLAASGKGSTSPNWFLKWCTWVMNEIEWNGSRTNGQRSHHTPDARRSGAADFFAGLAEVAADIDRDGAVAGPADENVPRGRVEIDG